ncbi:uncharacterized protein LOC117327345 [Pecten maximus]|uniref:uncharacterized protein LOC117327345 n=1 Tax=Pecten maximus TaxID=6579 RepID=UPI001458122E|nr:uncharacterized protein LOC117327345 [Pecten maximus]XP_033740174.1 uncharacterized protein LOC117327345 [Pecten maximus]
MKKFIIKILNPFKNRKRKENCHQPGQKVVTEESKEHFIDHTDSCQAFIQHSTDSIEDCKTTSDSTSDEYQDSRKWSEFVSEPLGPSLSTSSLYEDTSETFTDDVPNDYGLRRSYRFDSISDHKFFQNLGNQQSGLSASLYRNHYIDCISLSLNTSDLFGSNSASMIEALDLAEHLRPCCFDCRSYKDTAVARSPCLNPKAQNDVNPNRGLESLMETAIQENVEETSVFGEPVLPGDPKEVLNLRTDSRPTENPNHDQFKECPVLETNTGEYDSKHRRKDKNRTLYKPTASRKKKRQHSYGHCQRKTYYCIFWPKIFRQKKISKKGNKRRAHTLCQKSEDETKSPRREVHLFGMNLKDWKRTESSMVRRKAHAFHRNCLGKQQTLINRHALYNKIGCKCIWKNSRNKKRKKKKKNHLESWQTEETNHIFTRKMKGQSHSYVKNHQKRKPDKYLQFKFEFRRKKILKKKLQTNIERKTCIRHQKDWEGKESLLKKAHMFHLKGLEQRLRRKTHFHIKGREHQESWDNIQALCSIFSYKSSRKNSENKKRKKYLYNKENIYENDEENWQTDLETNSISARKAKVQKLTAVDIAGQSIKRPLPVNEGRPGGRPTTHIRKNAPQLGHQQADQSPQYSLQQSTQHGVQRLSHFRDQQADQSQQYNLQQPTPREAQNLSHVINQQTDQSAQLLREQTEQNSQNTELATQQFSAHGDVELPEQETPELLAHAPNQSADGVGLKRTEQADERFGAYSADFPKQLPSEGRGLQFCRRKIRLIHTCQIDCILAIILMLVRSHPEMEGSLENSNEPFQWLYLIWWMCKAKRFDYAKKFFWLKHGLPTSEDHCFDFKVKLEADWILEPLKINIFEKSSKCTNKSCTFDKEVLMDFKESIKAFSRRCQMMDKQYTCFQDCIDAWSDEDMPCSECDNGVVHVTRRLDCRQGSPPLLPFQTFFEVLESTVRLGEFLFPVLLHGYSTSLEQPEQLVIGNQRYRLDALSYAIMKDASSGQGYVHERCQIWNDKLGQWIYYDGEGWGEHPVYKLKLTEDKTLGKSFRVAYFRRMDD